MHGTGLLKGLGITMKKFFQKKVTEEYPDVMPKLPARSHGSFEFCPEKCISCGICVDSCPNRVIKLEYSKDEQGKKTLQNYSMNLGYCLFCGFCVEFCPKSAINFKTDFELACFKKGDSIVSWRGNVQKSEG